MKEGLIFANARAKAKEYNLFSQERLNRLLEAKTLGEGTRILLEANYGGGTLIDDAADFEKILLAEEKLTVDFVKEVAPENVGFECFFLQNDYHNVKVLLKAKYGKIEDISDMIMPDGLYSFSYLSEKFAADRLDFSPYIIEALSEISKKFDTGEGGPRIIDVAVDRAMYKDISERIAKNADKYVKDYFVTKIDTINIATLIRTYTIGESVGFFETSFIDGGMLGCKDLAEALSDPYQKLSSVLSGTVYGSFFAKSEKGDLSAFETAQDDYLLQIFSKNKSDMFSVAPIVGYYLAKKNEIKVLRVILVCIKNKVEKQDMKKRVRSLYA